MVQLVKTSTVKEALFERYNFTVGGFILLQQIEKVIFQPVVKHFMVLIVRNIQLQHHLKNHQMCDEM